MAVPVGYFNKIGGCTIRIGHNWFHPPPGGQFLRRVSRRWGDGISPNRIRQAVEIRAAPEKPAAMAISGMGRPVRRNSSRDFARRGSRQNARALRSNPSPDCRFSRRVPTPAIRPGSARDRGSETWFSMAFMVAGTACGLAPQHSARPAPLRLPGGTRFGMHEPVADFPREVRAAMPGDRGVHHVRWRRPAGAGDAVPVRHMQRSFQEVSGVTLREGDGVFPVRRRPPVFNDAGIGEDCRPARNSAVPGPGRHDHPHAADQAAEPRPRTPEGQPRSHCSHEHDRAKPVSSARQ